MFGWKASCQRAFVVILSFALATTVGLAQENKPVDGAAKFGDAPAKMAKPTTTKPVANFETPDISGRWRMGKSLHFEEALIRRAEKGTTEFVIETWGTEVSRVKWSQDTHQFEGPIRDDDDGSVRISKITLQLLADGQSMRARVLLDEPRKEALQKWKVTERELDEYLNQEWTRSKTPAKTPESVEARSQEIDPVAKVNETLTGLAQFGVAVALPDTPAAKQLVEQLVAQESAAAAEAATIRQLQANGQAESNQPPIAEHQRKLKNLLSTAFDLKLQLEELQVKELQSRLSRLERQIGQRKELREKIINRRAGELIEGDTLKWSVDSSKARPAQNPEIETGAAKAGSGFGSPGSTSAIEIPGPWLKGVTDLDSEKTPKELPIVRFEVRSRVTNFTLESGEKSDIVAVHYYQGVCVSPDGLVAVPYRVNFDNALRIMAVGPVEIDAEVVAQHPFLELSLLRLKRPLPGISFVALDPNPPGMMQNVQLCFPNRIRQAVTIESIDRGRNGRDPGLPLEDRVLLLRHNFDLSDSGLPVMSLSNRLVGLTRPDPGLMRDPETRTAKEPKQLVLLSAIPAVFIERLIAEYRAKPLPATDVDVKPKADQVVIDLYSGSQVLPGLGKNPGYSKLVQSLNALKGVTVNFREAGKGAVIVMAIVRDPSQRCQREARQTQKESELRIAINSALKAAGVEATQWEEND